MHNANWLSASAFVVLTATVALSKPPELPAPPTGEGRLPVYPDGEEFREPPVPKPIPKRQEPRKPLIVEVNATNFWPWIDRILHLHSDLLLRPLDL